MKVIDYEKILQEGLSTLRNQLYILFFIFRKIFYIIPWLNLLEQGANYSNFLNFLIFQGNLIVK